MKKTMKMAICAALVVGANIVAPAMPASDNVAMSIVAPTNVAYAETVGEEVFAHANNAQRDGSSLTMRLKRQAVIDYAASVGATDELNALSSAYDNFMIAFNALNGDKNNNEKINNLVNTLNTFNTALGEFQTAYGDGDTTQITSARITAAVNAYNPETTYINTVVTNAGINTGGSGSGSGSGSSGSSDYASQVDLSNEITRSKLKDEQHDFSIMTNKARIEALNNTVSELQNNGLTQNDLDAEAATRAKADKILAQAIDDEAKTRAEVDKILADSIVSESQSRIAADQFLNNKIDNEVARLDSKIDDVRSENRRGIALAVATANLRMPNYDEQHKWALAMGYGNFKGANAVSLGAFYQFNANFSCSLSFALSGSDKTIGAGWTLKL